MRYLLVPAALAALTACAPVDYCADSDVARDSALFASQTFVKDRLRSPASAQFPTSATERGVAVTKTAECTFTVIGYVDSQNGFGAMIRSAYIATVTPDQNGRYTLGELVMD